MHPSSESSLELIWKWFNECPRYPTSQGFGRHSFSRQSHPKRLLQISGDESAPSLKLVDVSADLPSASTIPHYVALSYCWGQSQAKVLRNENLFQWLTDIPHAQLPQTIKDAIYITRVLAFNYIWVDALCIIQNDIRDKHEEIQKMGGIYENAEVTISASRASTCHDGFLQPRNEPGEGSFVIPFRCRDGQRGTVMLWHDRSEQWDEPIDRRGWTLQESLISSCMLEFGTHQTRWHCNCHRYGVPHALKPNYLVDGWTRDKVEQSPVSIDWAPVVELEEVDRFRARVPTQTHRRLEERVIQTWKRLIRNYTRRAVSDPMDRLPALSAIAQRLEGLSTHRYAGGLWFGDVPHLLFWYPVDVESMTRSPERAAPSWSWASVTGAIDFIDVKETNISVLGVSQTELILWGILEETIIGREGSSSTGYLVFYEGMWGWEERNAIEGVVTMEAPSIFVSNEEWHHEMMFLLEVDREDGTGLVLRKVAEGVYCRAGRYSAEERKGRRGVQPCKLSRIRDPRIRRARTRLILI